MVEEFIITLFVNMGLVKQNRFKQIFVLWKSLYVKS
jgi:hypothetical protein